MITNHILIVDRHPEDLEPSKNLLRETGKFDFVECPSLEELFKIEKLSFDLVIIELNDETDQIIRYLLKKNEGKNPRFILSSSGYDEKYTSSLSKLGVPLECIDKPIRPNVLTKRIQYIFSDRKSVLERSLMKSEINQLDGLTATLSKHQKNVEEEISHFKKKVSVPIQSVISQILGLVNQKQDIGQRGMIEFLKKLMEQLHGDLYKPIFRDIEETLSESERAWLTKSFNIPTENINELNEDSMKNEEFGVKDFILYHKEETSPFPDGRKIELPYPIKTPFDQDFSELYRPAIVSHEFSVKTEHLRVLSYCPFEHKTKDLKQHILLMFQAFDLFRLYGIPIDRFKRLLDELHIRYLGNPYHNFYHAVDVCQFIFFLVSEVPSRASHDFLTTFDVLVLLLAGLFHDIDHPGRNNNFLIATNHLLSLRYNGISVLENHHCTEMFKLLLKDEFNLFPAWPREKFDLFRKSIIDTVLSTDMKNHFNFMAEFSARFPSHMKQKKEEEEEEGEGEGEELGKADGEGKGKGGKKRGGPEQPIPVDGRPESLLSLDELEQKKVSKEDRLPKKRSVKILLMQLIMKSADVCNQVRPFLFAKQWSTRCLNEFFAQGDLEKRLGIPVNMLGDRQKVSLPDSQVKFIKFIVYPLFDQLENALGRTCDGVFTDKINENLNTWQRVFEEEQLRLKREEVMLLEGTDLEEVQKKEKKEKDVDDVPSPTPVKEVNGEEGGGETGEIEDDDGNYVLHNVHMPPRLLGEEGNDQGIMRRRKRVVDEEEEGEEVMEEEEKREVEVAKQSCFRRCMDALELEEYEFYTLSYAIIGVALMFAIFRFLLWNSEDK